MVVLNWSRSVHRCGWNQGDLPYRLPSYHHCCDIDHLLHFVGAHCSRMAMGGLDGLYDKIYASAPQHYVAGNYAGSLLSFRSKDAIMFGFILKFGNLALVTMVRIRSAGIL